MHALVGGGRRTHRSLRLVCASAVVAMTMVWNAGGAGAATDLGTAWGSDGITGAVCNVSSAQIGTNIGTNMTLYVSCNLQGGSIVWGSNANIWVKACSGNCAWNYWDTGTSTTSTGGTATPTCTALTFAGRWQFQDTLTFNHGAVPTTNRRWATLSEAAATNGGFAAGGNRWSFNYYTNSGCSTLATTVPAQTNNTAYIASAGTAGASPAYPSSYYHGGVTSGGPTPCFVFSPATAAAQPATVVFDSTCTIGAASSDTYAWSVSGGTHTADDLTGPQGSTTFTQEVAYSVTLTITRSATTYTLTQSITIGSSSGGADSIDCPTGWSLLNPLSYGSLLQCLFIPSGTGLSDSMTDLRDSFDTSAFGQIIAPIGDLVDAWASFDTTATYVPMIDPCDGASLTYTYRDDRPETGLVSNHVTLAPYSTCDTNVAAFATTFKVVLTFVIYLGAAYAAFRIVASALGWQVGAQGKGGEE